MAFIAKQRYKLDLAPKGGWVIVYASQHDDGAREIEFEITNQGRAFSIPASINVSVQGIKLNGSYFSHSCSYSGNIVTMALADDMTDIVGKAICVLKFTNSSQQKLATAKFVLNVDTDSSSEGVIIDTEAEEIFNQMLNDIRAQAASISADIAELQSMVGSPLVASTASAMTNHNKIYVYVGSESGYTNGNWYYWNGSAWTSGGVYNAVAINIDSIPTQGSNNAVKSGGVYDAVATLKSGLEYKNWFSKYDTYSIINASGGSAPNSNVLNADGSITCNTSMGSVGQRLFKSNDQTKILKPGKYTISCRVTFADNSPSGQKQMVMRVGREYSNYSTVYVMTERGGSTRIDGDVKTGWAVATIEVTDEEVFVFECLPQSSTYSSLSMTTIIDHIQVESGERLTAYSEQIYFYEKPAMDVAYSAVDLTNELSYKRNIFIILKNNRKPYFDGVNRKLILAGDSLYLSANNASYVSIDYTTIQAQISSYSSITSNGLEIQLPSVGVFGYDITENVFKVFTTFNTPFSFEPFAYRYYNIQWGKLIDYAQGFELERAIYNNNHIIYTTQTAEHSFTRNASNGSIVWHSSGKLNTRVYLDAGTSTVAPEWADISQDISDKIVIDGTSADITIPSYSMLVYNTVDAKLHIKSINVVTLYGTSDIVLVFNTWANPVKGLLYDEYINRNVENNISSMVDANTVRAQSFNSSYHVGATDFANKCKEFSNLLLGDSVNNVIATTDFEAFLFFTDPHLLQSTGWENLCYEFISQIQKYYNSTPTTFCLCGGDWLGNSDLPDEACYKMGYIDGFMHSMFDNCYMLVGNHDTNYQGKKDAQSVTYTTRLSNQSIANLWYRKNNNKTYFSFNGASTKFYCFDTGTEGQTLARDNDYGWAQAQWFASALLSENSEHIAIAAHILYYDTDVLQPLTSIILDIAEAYNNRTSINVNGTSYNYSSASGKIEFGIFGHKHADELHTINSIPCIMTTNVRNNESLGASFDLVLVDYDGGIIKLVRVGSGDNREISLA